MTNTELKTEFKLRIIEAIRDYSFKFRTAKAQATSLDLNPSQFSRILNGETEKVISDSKWLQIANKYNVSEHPYDFVWQTAQTVVFNTIMEQLDTCQELSISGILCDEADIGKSFVAKYYVNQRQGAVYVDCSKCKSRTNFIKQLAKEFGIDSHGSLATIQKDLTQYINTGMRTKPLIILDEAGDLDYPAFLEIKALWNATEYNCGWYMMGADGLKYKIDRNRNLQKVGFTEIFSRMGNKYQRITPAAEQERIAFLKKEVAAITIANQSRYTPREMFLKTGGSLRRVYIEIRREKADLKNIEVAV